MRTLLVSLVSVVLGGCFCGDGSGGGAGGGSGGGGGSKTLQFDLVEMTGTFTLSGQTVSGTCTNVTSEAKVVLSLSKPDPKAVTWERKTGTLSGYVDGTMTLPATVGTTTCGASAPQACPTFPDKPFTGAAFIGVTSDPQTLGMSPAPGVAFVPVLNSVARRSLCAITPFDIGPTWLRGKPLTVAQVESGRFVIEAKGLAPIAAPPAELGNSDPQPVTGSMAYDFRLVFQTPDYDPKNAVAPVDLPSFDACLFDVDSTAAEDEAAAAAYADGGSDLPLNATGCRRLKVTRGAGTETMTYERTYGGKFVFDTASGLTTVVPDTRILYTRTEDVLGIHESFDSDEDGTIDRTTETTFANGQWNATVATEKGVANPSVLSRTRIDATTMMVREERGGTLIDEFVAPIVQHGCFDANSMQAPECKPGGTAPTCTGVAPVKCDATTSKTLRDALQAAVKKGEKCFKNVGVQPNPAAKVAALAAKGKITFYCTSDPCADSGQLLEPNPDKSVDFLYNTARNTTASARASTLFHEALHGDPGFTHDGALEAAAYKACKLTLVDRTYACEKMCFSPTSSSSCDCMRCLSPGRTFKATSDVCSKCEAFGSCGARSEGGKPVASAIGAWCGRGKTFCDTKAECDTACAPFGGGCQQLKATCDAGCN